MKENTVIGILNFCAVSPKKETVRYEYRTGDVFYNELPESSRYLN